MCKLKIRILNYVKVHYKTQLFLFFLDHILNKKASFLSCGKSSEHEMLNLLRSVTQEWTISTYVTRTLQKWRRIQVGSFKNALLFGGFNSHPLKEKQLRHLTKKVYTSAPKVDNLCNS